jgi:hypothetical protein
MDGYTAVVVVGVLAPRMDGPNVEGMRGAVQLNNGRWGGFTGSCLKQSFRKNRADYTSFNVWSWDWGLWTGR